MAWVFSCKYAASWPTIIMYSVDHGCIFSEHLFLRTHLEGCFCKTLSNKLWIKVELVTSALRVTSYEKKNITCELKLNLLQNICFIIKLRQLLVPQNKFSIAFRPLSGDVCTQLTFTCSKSAIETLIKVWNMFKVKNKYIPHTFF